MKVLHVIPSVSPVRGGPSQAVLEMVNTLCQQGVTAEIVTTNDHGQDLLNVPLEQWIKHSLSSSDQSVPVRFFARFSPKISAIREFAFSGSFTTWLWQHICDYDLVHIHAIFSYPSTIAMVIARLKGVPYIIRPLGQLCEWSLQQSAVRKKFYLKLIEQSNLNLSAAVHFTSVQEQQESSRLGLKAASFVLPHGLVLPEQIPNARSRLRKILEVPNDQPLVLFLSRLHPKKGLEYLIPALAVVKPQFTFVLAGGGTPEYEAEVRSLLTTHNLIDRTRFTGFVEGEMKDLLLQGADLFVLTSHSENFGVAVLEAMAAGLPVVVTPGVALATVVQQQAVGYVPDLEVGAIAASISDCLTESESRRDMGHRARRFISDHYTWKQIVEQLISVYTKILNQSIHSSISLTETHSSVLTQGHSLDEIK